MPSGFSFILCSCILLVIFLYFSIYIIQSLYHTVLPAGGIKLIYKVNIILSLSFTKAECI